MEWLAIGVAAAMAFAVALLIHGQSRIKKQEEPHARYRTAVFKDGTRKDI